MERWFSFKIWIKEKEKKEKTATDENTQTVPYCYNSWNWLISWVSTLKTRDHPPHSLPKRKKRLQREIERERERERDRGEKETEGGTQKSHRRCPFFIIIIPTLLCVIDKALHVKCGTILMACMKLGSKPEAFHLDGQTLLVLLIFFFLHFVFIFYDFGVVGLR